MAVKLVNAYLVDKHVIPFPKVNVITKLKYVLRKSTHISDHRVKRKESEKRD